MQLTVYSMWLLASGGLKPLASYSPTRTFTRLKYKHKLPYLPIHVDSLMKKENIIIILLVGSNLLKVMSCSQDLKIDRQVQNLFDRIERS